MALSIQQLNLLTTTLQDVFAETQRAGKDGEKVKAFVEDLFDAIKANPENAIQLSQIGVSLALLARNAFAGRNVFALLFTDPLREFRFRADDYAKAFDFKRYRALRGI